MKGGQHMDPYLSTIIKQSVALGAVIGIAAALIYGLMQYSKLQYAMTLNMVPGQLS
jgi:hypothetical protein